MTRDVAAPGCAFESTVVVLRSATDMQAHQAVLCASDGAGRVNMLLTVPLPVGATYRIDHPAADVPDDAVWRVEVCRPGVRPGEVRLGHHFVALRRLDGGTGHAV